MATAPAQLAAMKIDHPLPAATATQSDASSSLTRLQLDGPIAPTLLRLALPNLGEAAARVAFVTADAMFVGWLGADALAGLGLVMPFFFLVQTATAAGLGLGVSAAVARSLGAGDRARANDLAAHALVIALVTGVLVTLFMLVAGPWLYGVLGGTGVALELALLYAAIVFLGAPLVCLSNLLANVVRGSGEMRVPSAVIVGGEALHLAITPTLVLGVGPLPSLGIAGAAWGLLVPYAFGCAVLLVFLGRGRGVVRLARPSRGFDRRLFAAILQVGLPASINNVLTQALAFAVTALAGLFGTAAIAAYAAAVRLEMVLIPIVFGLGSAVVAMVGTNLGAGNVGRAKRIAWTGGLIGGLIGTAMALICLLLPEAWMGLFTTDPQVSAIGVAYLRIVGWSAPLFGLGLALYFAAQGAGRAVSVLVALVLRIAIAVGGGWLVVGPFGGSIEALFVCSAVGAGVVGLWMVAAVRRDTWS
jgi:putative MATE family efflux protein